MVGRFMTSAKRPADISPRNHALRAICTSSAPPASVLRSDLALGVRDALDQVVAALIGADLAGQALLHLDVELIAPGEMPGLKDRGADLAYVRGLVPDLQDGADVAPLRPALLHRVAVHHRGEARAEHRILREVDRLRVVA